jgi:transcriptional regulator with XRE-family HTH domain
MYPNLKLQLWKLHMRQNRLAQLLELDETVLSKIINGFRKPSAQLQADIARLLQCDASWLFGSNSSTDHDDPGIVETFPAPRQSQP